MEKVTVNYAVNGSQKVIVYEMAQKTQIKDNGSLYIWFYEDKNSLTKCIVFAHEKWDTVMLETL